ncbi:MAG: hypothetical protein JSW71_13255 [Gemmatimonadota bacterium]|nr:MAG: hypothetical protein JSW71_13255 [Gemmatimonadota bacterium]
MDDTDISRQIRDLKESLKAIDRELSRREDPPPGLAEFKTAVDDVRSSLIAVITASHSQSYEGPVWRFRARRALGLLQNVVADVVDGTVTADTQGFEECYALVTDILERLGCDPAG